MVHGPLTASNLLVTWRRCHGDAEITRRLARSRDGSSKTSRMGHGEVQSFRHASRPRDVCANNMCTGEMRESERNKRGEETPGCFQIIPSLLRQELKTSPSLLTFPTHCSLGTLTCSSGVFLFVCLCSGRFYAGFQWE